jgi:hypothetical protein
MQNLPFISTQGYEKNISLIILNLATLSPLNKSNKNFKTYAESINIEFFLFKTFNYSD